MLHVFHEMAIYIKKKKKILDMFKLVNPIIVYYKKKQVNFLHFNKTILWLCNLNLLLNYFIYICTIYCCWIQSTLYVLWEGFSSRSPINWYCPLWFMSHEFVQSHIGERRLPHVPSIPHRGETSPTCAL